MIDGGSAVELARKLFGQRHVHCAPFDKVMLGPAAGAGEQPHALTRGGQVIGDGGTGGSGSGDDVQFGHWLPDSLQRAMLSISE